MPYGLCGVSYVLFQAGHACYENNLIMLQISYASND